MDCLLDTPLKIGSTSAITSAFSHLHCTGSLEMGLQSAVAMQGIGYILWFGFGLLALIQGVLLGVWIFKR